MSTQGSAVEQRMGKAKVILFCIALWVTSWVGCYQTAMLVVVNDMYIAFPGQEGMVTAFVSWPMFAIALGSILGGFILQKMSTKLLAIISCVLLLFGIVATWFDTNITAIVVCVMLMAFGAGLCNTAGLAIIGEVFVDDVRSARHIGFYYAAQTLLGGGGAILAGFLAVNHWIQAFWINWIALPMLVLVIFFFPTIKPSERIEDTGAAAEPAGADAIPGKTFSLRFWVFFIVMGLFFFTETIMYSYQSVLVAENNLGDASFAGLCGGVMTLCAIPTSLAFGVFYEKLYRKCTFLGIIVCIAGFLWLHFAPSAVSMMAMSIIEGLAVGLMVSLNSAYAGSIVPPEKNGLIMGIMLFLYNMSISIGAYAFDALIGVFGSLTGAIIVAVVILVIALAIEIVVQVVHAGQKRVTQS